MYITGSLVDKRSFTNASAVFDQKFSTMCFFCLCVQRVVFSPDHTSFCTIPGSISESYLKLHLLIFNIHHAAVPSTRNPHATYG